MLFFISLLMVFVSSYLCASVFCTKDKNHKPCGPSGFLYTLITMFAQVVLTFELLSLFKAISKTGVLVLNIFFLTISICLWLKKGRPVYIPRVKKTFEDIFGALKKDKILMIMAFGFVFYMAAVVILDCIMPVSGGDALTYHLNRASYWLHQGSLSHFVITDDRNLVMPINSEIIYLWNLLFFKNDIGLFFVSFIGYIGAVFSIYNILEYFSFSKRRILWTIFIVSSFASVMAEISSLETDVLLAGLVLSCITLYLYALKEKSVLNIFYAALVYALAMGTKSPAIIAFPGVFLLLAYFSYRTQKKEFYKPLIAFAGFLALNFLVFSSYNYILNFIDYSNPLGSESAKAVHGFRGGIKAFVANYIRYMFMLFDFSGFRYSEYVGEHITNAKLAILAFLHIPQDLGVEMSDYNEINNRFINVKVGAGILGFLVFLPSLVAAVVAGIVKRHNKKLTALCAFAAMFFINVFCLSFSIAYMVFSIRFLTFLIVISSPVIALSYMKKTNILKLLILFYVMSYFLIMSVNLSGRQFGDIAKLLIQSPSFSQAREKIRCALYIGYEGKAAFCYIRDEIRKMPTGSKIALFSTASDKFYILNMLNSHGYKIDTLLPENAPLYDLSGYDYIIMTDKVLISTVLTKTTAQTKTEYQIDKDGNAYFPKYRPFTCVYEKHGRGFYTSEAKNGIIMDSRCFIDIPFFEKRGFVIERAYDFKAETPQASSYITIYKNTRK